MIILTKTGGRSTPEYLFAYSGSVFVFQYYGNTTYNDTGGGIIWNWTGIDNSIDEIIGVVQDDGSILTNAVSVIDCIIIEGSFFWDDPNGLLYVHWFDHIGDHAIDKNKAAFSKLKAGYASGCHRLTQNVFDGVYYSPIITKLTGLTKKVDPLELGLIAFSTSSISLSNHNGQFDSLLEEASVGLPIWIYAVQDTDTVLTNSMRIFTGYLNGTKNTREDITFNVQETRLYENKPVCQNQITVAVYPDCGDKAGELMPVAFGDIRRGKMILLNEAIIEDPYPDPLVLTFLVADPAHYSVLSITNLWNENNVEFPIDSVDLINCTVTITSDDYTGTVEEFVEFDFDNWRWEGTGYDIAGTYNNGLDIIRALFLKLSSIPYTPSTYDTTQWGAQTIIHDEAVGISIQSDRGFIEEIIQPITVSLYGIVDILGDGRISFRSRNTSAPVLDTVYAVDQATEPDINMVSEKTVSELVIQYSPDFVDEEKNIQYLYDAEKDEIIARYGINRRTPLSPIKTVLHNLVDVQALAISIMQIYSSPDKNIIVQSLRLLGRNLFDIIGIDVGRHDNQDILYGEVLEIAPDYLAVNEKETIRIIDNPVIEYPAPEPLLIAALCYAQGSVIVLFSEILSMPVTGYRIYYTKDPINWSDNIIDYTILQFDADGNLYQNITGLDQGELYYFRVSAYNAIGESALSNYVSCFIWTIFNAYRFNGNYSSGYIIDSTNALGGTALASWAKYDGTHLYNSATNYQPALLFVSGTCFSQFGFTLFRILGHTASGFIYLQYRYSTDNITWSAWTAQQSIAGDIQIVLANYRYFEYRIIGEPTYWFDDDYFLVKRLQ